jgi:hypothetical protein
MSENSNITFILSNGTLFESDTKIWEISGFVNEVIKENENEEIKKENENEEINYLPLENISLSYLIKVVDFLNIYHDNPKSWVNIEKPIRSSNIFDIVPSIYADYINQMTEEEVKKLASVSDYLDIKQLTDLASLKIATLLKPYYESNCKEEVRRILGINIE